MKSPSTSYLRVILSATPGERKISDGIFKYSYNVFNFFSDPLISNYGAEIDRYITSFGEGVRNDPIYKEMMTSSDSNQLIRSGEGARPDLGDRMRPDPIRALRHLKLMVVGMME